MVCFVSRAVCFASDALPLDDIDPLDDADALDELGHEIATLAAHIHAATHRLLTLVRDFDHRRGWELDGQRSCAHWLALRTGIDLGAAREKVRVARALADLPETSASMARGELSFSAVRALTRVARPESEGDLLELARGCTTAQIERMVRGWRRGSRKDEATLERERHESRTLSVFPDEEGMYVVRGRLDPEVGALLMRALEAAGDALFRQTPGGHGTNGTSGTSGTPGTSGIPAWASEDDRRRAAAQRRADAVGLLAERALAAGFGTDVGGGGGARGTCGTSAERYQVVLHVDADTLEAGGEPGRSELEDGTRVSAETSRRLSCDAALVRITHDGRDGHEARGPAGSILDVGRRTRTIPPALRRALEARDRGCRFPGCGSRFTDGHHVKHWADGGDTSLSNCFLICKHHHRLVHEGGWRVVWWGEGRPVFVDPRGGSHFDGRWKAPRPGSEVFPSERPVEGPVADWSERPVEGLSEDPVEGPSEDPVQGRSERPVADPAQALVEQNRARGVSPDGWTAGARWEREEDVPDDVYFRALEALG